MTEHAHYEQVLRQLRETIDQAKRVERDRACAEDELGRLRQLPAQLTAAKADAAKAESEREIYRLAWHSARARAAERRAILADHRVEGEALRAKLEQAEARIAALTAECDGAMEGWRNESRIWSARIAAVRALHQPRAFVESWTCAECSRTGSVAPAWPCPTIAALDGPADQPAAVALLLEALDADALTQLICAAQYRRAEIDPDQRPADCAEGHTYKVPCSGAYPDTDSSQDAAEVSRSLGGMVDRMLGVNVGGAFREDTADARLLREPSDAEVRAQVRDIIAPHFPGRPGATDCPAWCADGHMYDGSCLIGPALDGVIGESRDPQHPGWYWSCEGGDGACFGWLSLDHPTAAAARRAYDRHVKREHAEPAP